MVKLTCPGSTSRGTWHSLRFEPRSQNSHPTSRTIIPRTHKAGLQGKYRVYIACISYFQNREVKQSPLDDDTEKKLPAQSPQNKMSDLEF